MRGLRIGGTLTTPMGTGYHISKLSPSHLHPAKILRREILDSACILQPRQRIISLMMAEVIIFVSSGLALKSTSAHERTCRCCFCQFLCERFPLSESTLHSVIPAQIPWFQNAGLALLRDIYAVCHKYKPEFWYFPELRLRGCEPCGSEAHGLKTARVDCMGKGGLV